MDDARVVNVGSVGLPLDGDRRAAYGSLELEGGECEVALHRVEYDVDEVIAMLDEVEHPSAGGVASRLSLAAVPN